VLAGSGVLPMTCYPAQDERQCRGGRRPKRPEMSSEQIAPAAPIEFGRALKWWPVIPRAETSNPYARAGNSGQRNTACMYSPAPPAPGFAATPEPPSCKTSLRLRLQLLPGPSGRTGWTGVQLGSFSAAANANGFSSKKSWKSRLQRLHGHCSV